MQFKTLAVAAFAGLASAQSLTEVLQQNAAQLSNLTTLLSQFPDLVTTLGGASNITILAPSNAALGTFLNSSAGQSAASNTELVRALLTYHVLNGSYANFTAMPTFVPTLLTAEAYTNVTGGQVVEAVGGTNATIYSGLKNNSTASATVNFTGGVVHVIDRVLTLPANISSTASSFGLSSAYGALQAANLLGAVNGLRDATVFVPNNAAFQQIGSALPNLTTEQVQAILQYHVIEGTVAYSSSLSNMSVSTLQGGNLTITVFNSTTVFVNDARVLIPDVLVANGVVHVIDQVLNPLNATATPGAGATGGSPAFSGASSVSEAPFTSGVPTASSTVNTASIASTATSSSSGAAWMAKPTDMGAILLGGAAMVFAL